MTRRFPAMVARPSTTCGCGRPNPRAISTCAISTRATTSRRWPTRTNRRILSKVLYPNDSTEMGRELRLKQQYFFVCASLAGHAVAALPRNITNLDAAAGQGGDAAERHPSVHRHRGDDASAGGCSSSGLGRAWDMTHAHFFLHQPHADAGSAGDLAGAPCSRKSCRAICRSSTRSTIASCKQVMHQFPGDGELLQRLSIIDEAARGRCACRIWPLSAAIR